MAVAVTDGFHKYPGYECPYKYKYVKHSLLNSAVCVLLETGHAAQAWLPELSVGCWNGILGAVPASSPLHHLSWQSGCFWMKSVFS